MKKNWAGFVLVALVAALSLGGTFVSSAGNFSQTGLTNLNGFVRLGDATLPTHTLEIAGYTSGVLKSDGSGTITSSLGSNGDFLSVVAGVPTWTTIASGGGSVTLAGDVTGNSATNTAVALTGVTNSVDMKANSLTWSKTTTPVIIQAPETTDVQPTDFEITPGHAFGPTNKKSGDLVVNLWAPVSGTDEGDEDALIVRRGFVTNLWGFRSSQQFYSTIYAKAAIAAPTTTNYTLLADGTSLSVLNAPSGGIAALAVNNSSALYVSGTEVTVARSFLTFPAATSAPSISQAQATSGNGAIMSVQAQSGFGTGDTNGGNLYLKAGVKNAGGTDGRVSLYAAGTPVVEVKSNGVDLYTPFVTFAATASNPSIAQLASAGNHGGIMTITGQAGDGTNKNGGIVKVIGGAATGAGLSGSSLISTGDGFAVQSIVVGESQHVVSLCRTGELTSTQMGASTGDGVIYIANATTTPSANSVSGGILYVDPANGHLKFRTAGGATTDLTP